MREIIRRRRGRGDIKKGEKTGDALHKEQRGIAFTQDDSGIEEYRKLLSPETRARLKALEE